MRPTQKFIAGTLLICLSFFSISAQDFHFSQFYNSPLNLNPALTGKVNGGYRLAANYRNQWFALTNGGSPFVTYAGSIDAPFQVLDNDAVGVGLTIVHDRGGIGILNTSYVMLSGAYHKALSKNGRHTLALGFQGGYLQRRIDQEQLVFFNQFDAAQRNFNTNLPNGERFSESYAANFDLQTGLLWSSVFNEKVTTYAGIAIHHAFSPKQEFLEGMEYRLPRRYTGHAGADFGLSKRLRLIPSFIYMRQGEASQFNLGTSLGIFFNEEVNFYIGSYYRLNPGANGVSDAVIPYTAFEYKAFRLGFSYDATISGLRVAPDATGAFEVSLIYTGKPFPKKPLNPLLFCPRF